MEKPTSAYIPFLDGLRGVSILLVFIAHIGFDKIIPGGLGVTIFFFISGYIITNLLINEYQKNGGISLKFFYIRRFLRLYPPLLFMIFLFGLYVYFGNARFNGHELLAALLYYENYFLFYTHNLDHSCLMILWSLAVEEHFYLIFPIVFWLLIKSPGKLTVMMVMLIFIPLIFRFIGALQYGFSDDTLDSYCYLLTHTRFDSIIFGCMASVMLYVSNLKWYDNILSNKTLFILALASQVICLVVRDPMFRNTVRYSIQGLSLLILIPAVLRVPYYAKVKQVFSNKPLVFIGRLSYSIYLTHMIAVESLMSIKTNGHVALYYCAVVLLTAIMALSSFYLIEKPLTKLRKRLRPAVNTNLQGALEI